MAILAFHSVDQRPALGINNCKPNKFKCLCDYVKAADYDLCDLDEFLAVDNNRNKMCFTFDDGLKSFAEIVFPILKDLNIPAAVFIPSGMIGRKNSWEYWSFISPREHLSALDIRQLADAGIEIGSHGHSHIALTALSDRFLRMELEKSKRLLEDLTGRPVHYISYPFGRVNGRVEAMALEVGYQRGFSLAQLPGESHGFTLRRSAIYAWDSPYSIAIKTGGGPMENMERLKERIINYYSGGTILLNRLRGRNLPAVD